MVAIEAKRFARHPLFIVGVLIAYGLTLAIHLTNDKDFTDALMAFTIIPAFFIGLPSLVVAARLTRSTEVAVEAMVTAPQGEARRTLAVIGSCSVPFAAGMLWIAEVFAILAVRPAHPDELWFGTMRDIDVWSIMLAGAPVACLGAALLGVLSGRWLRFPGAPTVTVVAVVAVVYLLGGALQYGEHNEFRLFAPWAMFHTGTMTEDAYQGIPHYAQAIMAGNPVWYLLYLVTLCGLAAGGAVWHDRAARTARLRWSLLGLLGLAAVFVTLAIMTGVDHLMISEPLPYPSSE
ncbi:hypothetical protein [Nocardioides sambongensis]|uniref:hypothetical protein n=1 Tax=Nocardioides sambongensis TaxID=2589074 RepID=UPI0018C8A540|nr:hypothetical protein [Nocardioides sambongensis]